MGKQKNATRESVTEQAPFIQWSEDTPACVTLQRDGEAAPDPVAPTEVSVTLPGVIQVPCAKAGYTFHVHTADLPESAIVYLLAYGLRQQNDVHSQVSPAEKGEVMDRMLARFAALGRGETPKGGGRKPTRDSVTVEFIEAVGRAMGWKRSETQACVKEVSSGGVTTREVALKLAVKRLGRKATPDAITKLHDTMLRDAAQRVADREARNAAADAATQAILDSVTE